MSDRLFRYFGYVRANRNIELRNWAVERAIEMNPTGIGGWAQNRCAACDILQFVVWGCFAVTRSIRRFFAQHRRRNFAYRWGFWRLIWWKPLVQRGGLTFREGFHCWWGPFHVWDVTGWDGARRNGGGWR